MSITPGPRRSGVTAGGFLGKHRAVRFFSPLRPLLLGWLLSFLGWGLVALAMSANFVANTSLPWSAAILPSLRDWLPWAIFTPLIFRLAARFPLDRHGWKRALPVHLLACAATVALCHGWKESLMMRRGPLPDALREPGRFSGPRGPGDGPGPRRMGSPPSGVGEDRERPGPPPDSRDGSSGPRRGPPPKFFFDMFHFAAFELPIYFMLLGVAHAVVFYRRDQERAASLVQARLEALKMQLQPHFLFNALNAIAELMHKDVEAADAMLAGLSNLLRLSLQSSGELELPLRRELEFVESYLALEHLRFGDRLRYELDLAPDTLVALVPAFVLQPLVENSVRHGLAPKTGPGRIIIRSRRDGAKLRISVADDGVGLPKDQPPREGIGLANTRARLRELYGAAASLEVRDHDGVTVELTLPFLVSS